MTLAKKKTRIITIDDIRYRWLVTPKKNICILVAEKEGVKGQKIEVCFETDSMHFWVEFPNIDHLNLKILKPKDVESIIRRALNNGWKPDQKGKALVFDWRLEKLIIRTG